MILAACCLLMPFLLRASGNFSLWAAYAYAPKGGAHEFLSMMKDTLGPQAEIKAMDSGLTAGIDGAYWYYAWWGIGARIAYTQLSEGSAAGEEAGLPVKYTVTGSMIETLAGVPLLFEFFDGKISAGGGIYGGLGIAGAETVKTGGTPWTEANIKEASGYCFVIEIPLRLTYHISSSFLADLNFSWKSAEAAGMDVLVGKMNFSGISAGLGLNWRFSSKDWPWYNKKFSLTE